MENTDSPTAAAVYRCHDLPTAVKIAQQIAGEGDKVLLSPGFASYDQFVNFEKRGEEFSRLVSGRI
jgi:UDP-N-acetylmuramoylalanine--D-glutamate ligase